MALTDQRGEAIVSNGTLYHSGNYESIAEGCVLRVEFEYVCHLNCGIYFLNAGVMTSEAGATATYAHRIMAATLIIVRHSQAEVVGCPPRVIFLNDGDMQTSMRNT